MAELPPTDRVPLFSRQSPICQFSLGPLVCSSSHAKQRCELGDDAPVSKLARLSGLRLVESWLLLEMM